MKGSDSHYFIGLDGMRGVAALVVVWMHMGEMTGELSTPKGYLAVDLFFALSGAVIANAYEGRLLAGLSLRDFCLIRYIRLYPLYFLGSALGAAALALSANGLSLRAIILALFVVPDWTQHNRSSFPLDGPAWSLFMEFWINVFYACFIRRMRFRLVAGLMFCSALGMLSMTLFSKAHNVDVGWTFVTVPHGFFRIAYSFFMGVLLWRLRQSGGRPTVFVAGSSNALVLLLLTATGLLLTAHPLPQVAGGYDLLCVLLIFPVLVYLAMEAAPRGRLAEACAILGIVSYPVYCLHHPLIRLFGLFTHFPQWLGFVAPCLFVAAVAAAGYALNFSYDAPIRRRLQDFLLKKHCANKQTKHERRAGLNGDTLEEAVE